MITLPWPSQRPSHEFAKKAYAIYMKEGRPLGLADQNWADTEAQLRYADAGQANPPERQDVPQGHQDHHAHMAADCRERFWVGCRSSRF